MRKCLPARERPSIKIDHTGPKHGLYEIKGIRAIDGDTIEAIIKLPFGALGVERLRLKGWWAPELHGPQPNEARHCQQELQRFTDSHVCFIYSKSERQDKYGRYIVELWADGKVVHPETVLGLWQLTEAQHRAEADWVRKQKAAELPEVHPEPMPAPPHWQDDAAYGQPGEA